MTPRQYALLNHTAETMILGTATGASKLPQNSRTIQRYLNPFSVSSPTAIRKDLSDSYNCQVRLGLAYFLNQSLLWSRRKSVVFSASSLIEEFEKTQLPDESCGEIGGGGVNVRESSRRQRVLVDKYCIWLPYPSVDEKCLLLG